MQTGAIYTSILSHHSEVYTIVNGLRLHRQQVDSGVDKHPPTQSPWLEHIRRAHVQASVWLQDKPNLPTSRLNGRCKMTNY